MDKINTFQVSLYGNLEKYNEVLSKVRCRVFYKYANRNGTYITDQFAEKLLSTISYTPVKGIYEPESDDYTDHGVLRSEGRIYGIVPENYNFAWENHLDEDGVERTYACVDVLIYTSLYDEAKDIVGKSQSMELYGPSLKYHEAIVEGKRYIVFDEGCFLGLQILGDKVEPCFEGASFYSIQKNVLEYIFELITKYGGTKMPKFNFKLSDSEKFEAIWNLLNPKYNEENNWEVNYVITDVFDDYALTYNYETCEHYRAYYTKSDENNMVELGEMVKCYIVDVTESEKNTLDTLRALNGNTYELVSEVLTNAQDNYEKVSAFSTKIEELNTNISTLESEKETMSSEINKYTAQLEDATNTINSLTEENGSLKEFKNNVETSQKNAIIDEYSEHLSDEILSSYRENINNYTSEELDKELAYELKKNNSSIFNKTPETAYVPKEIPLTGIAAILSKYKK